MKWKNLFSPVENISADKVRSTIEKEPSGSYQLLDVRQPKEYAASHLPGSLLIPLKELPARITELDSRKPTIVYCASGGRSRAAAQFLKGRDFKKVLNMAGGIKAWQGRTALGPEEVGLEFFTEDAEYSDGLALAYAMEDGLQQFYLRLAEDSADQEQQQLLKRLAGFEDIHKKRLLDEFRQLHDAELSLPHNLPAIMEGGRRLEDFLKRAPALLHSTRDLLHLAMGLEIQAHDLYIRMAQQSNREQTRDFFLRIADEERQHLNYMTEEFEKLL
jgi:rhodanese-related sulfurtransferase/rubrerythrin